MLNFFSKSSLEYESIVSAVMICLTDGNQNLLALTLTVIY